jgi:hypothetical protein
MATFISLTHLVNNKRVPVYVNVDQICRIGDSVGGGPGYATNILLSQGQLDVCETVADVMLLISPPRVAATTRARRSPA